MKDLHVFDLSGFSEPRHQEVLVSRFAPYLQVHHQLKTPHGHSFYHIVFFVRGNGNHTIDFDRFAVKPNQIYFMVPGQIHNWQFDGAVDGYVINFSTTFFQSFLLRPDYVDEFPFFSGSTRDAVIEVPEEFQAKIKSLFEEMLTINLNISPRQADRLRLLILQLFFVVADINNQNTENAPSYNITLLRNFQKLIEQNFTKLKLPKEYAELLFVTPNHLNALCSQMLGISAGELIRKRIVLEAKRLLVNLELPIASISCLLNFSDNSYFSKFFKKHTGSTPEEFRRQILKPGL
ncbi:AraC family transcriptional regulator [Paradesertivirga mongoliensis]|uniref:AraC family transcriptional regulator n=1 Tax=Paradesertivirga mongoliensis TaxID=2100740 RepID=A0ABW4ZRB8_9SPHI|nr:helix-turn-helix transcriptional regulator [Pedobacter mongoliensis]